MASRSARVSKDTVVRTSLSDQIVDMLRQAIIEGKFAPGTRLIQDELCERYGTSRMPVRDALRQLTHEGLIEEVGGQRVVVALGREELADAHHLIAVLHGWAAGQAAVLADAAEVADLQSRLDRALAASDSGEFGHAAWDFHRQVNILAHSNQLLRTLRLIQRANPRVFPLSFPEEMEPTKERYRVVMKAIVEHDAGTAEAQMRAFSLDLVGWMLNLIGADSAEPAHTDDGSH